MAAIAAVKHQQDERDADPASSTAGKERPQDAEQRAERQESQPYMAIALHMGPAEAGQAKNAEQHAQIPELDDIGMPLGAVDSHDELLPPGPGAGADGTNGQAAPQPTQPWRIGDKQQHRRNRQDEANGLVDTGPALAIPPGLRNSHRRIGGTSRHDGQVTSIQS